MASTGWSQAEILVRLGLSPDYVPATGDEVDAIYEKAVDLLRTSETKSGYQEVYPMRKRWQAKPYLEPGDQRNLGSFATPRIAAMAVLSFKMGDTPLPQKAPPKANQARHGGAAQAPPEQGEPLARRKLVARDGPRDAAACAGRRRAAPRRDRRAMGGVGA